MEAAVDQSEVPLVVHRVDEVDNRVKAGHGGFSESQIQQKIVGDCPHAFVRHNDPDHRKITYNGHNHDTTVCESPEDDSPDWLYEVVPEISPVVHVIEAAGVIWHLGGTE